MKSLATLVFTLFTFEAVASGYPSCSFSENKTVLYSDQKVHDTLNVSVIGNPCYEAELNIQIVATSGKIVYEYKAPFKKHIAVQWDDPSLDKDAKAFIKRVMNPKSFGISNKLPKWKESHEYYDDNYQELDVAKSYYQKLIKNNWVTFSHPVHYESWKVMVYDKNKNKSIKVSSGGL